MSGHSVVPLNDLILESQNGLSKRSGADGVETPVLRLGDIKAGAIDESDPREIRLTAKELAKYALQQGDLVCIRVNGSKALVGRVIQFRANRVWAYCDHFIRFRPNQALIDHRYLAHYFNSQTVRRHIELNMVSSAGQNTVSQGTMLDIPVPCPGLETQREIVAELEKQFSRLDEAVANLQRVKANLKRYKASVLKAAVEGRLVETEATLARREGRTYETGEQLLQRIVGIEEIRTNASKSSKSSEQGDCPEGWARTSIGRISEFSFYGPRFSSDAYSDKGVFVLRTTDIDESGRVDTSTAPRIDLDAKDLAKYRVAPGDLLVTRTGSLGRVALFEDKVDAIPGAYLIQIRLRLDEHSRKFLLMFLQSPEGQARLTGGGAGVGRQNLNAPTIAAIAFGLPPRAEQARIVAEVDRHLSIIREVEAEVDANLQRAQALRQATLMKCFSY